MKNNVSIILVSLVVWAGCFYLGTDLSRRRPLGVDELFTHINAVEPLAHNDLLSGKGLKGNNGPLFYMSQKVVTEQLGYVVQGKANGERLVHDKRAQILLRRASNVFMSGAITLTFFAVAWFYSVPFAFFATVVFFTFPGTWLYWAQAQPYSLWVFLTVLQSVFSLRILQERTDKSRTWIGLLIVNILLSMTNTLGVLQVCVTSFVIWAVNKKRLFHALGLAVAPLTIGFYYYLQRSGEFKYGFDDVSMMDKVPLEYWVLIPVILGIRYVNTRLRDDLWLRLDLWVLVGGFILLRAVHTHIDILNSGTFWHII